jgi:hypothetical protein
MRRDFFFPFFFFLSQAFIGLGITLGFLSFPYGLSPGGFSKLIPVYIVFPFGACSCTYSKPEIILADGAIQFLEFYQLPNG